MCAHGQSVLLGAIAQGTLVAIAAAHRLSAAREARRGACLRMQGRHDRGRGPNLAMVERDGAASQPVEQTAPQTRLKSTWRRQLSVCELIPVTSDSQQPRGPTGDLTTMPGAEPACSRTGTN